MALVSRDKQLEWFGVSEIHVMSSPHGEVGQIHRCTLQNGSVAVWVVTAMDEAARRMTFKDVYQTQEVSDGPGGGSRVGSYMTFEEANPEVPQLIEGLMQRGLERLKAYCEAEARSS